MIPRTNAAIPPACRVLWSGGARRRRRRRTEPTARRRTQRATGLPRSTTLAPFSSSPIHRRS